MFPALTRMVFVVWMSGDLPYSDIHRFPFDSQAAYLNYLLARNHLNWVEANLDDKPWFDDAQWRFKCWDLLDDIRRVHPLDVRACRAALKRLKLLLGEENYWRGQMPFPVPWKRFRDRERWER